MASSEPLIGRKSPASAFLSPLLSFGAPLLCFGLVSCTSLQALRNAGHDPSTAAFAVSAGTVLLLLWLSFREFEKLESGPSPRRQHLKLIILLLSVLLNALFTLRVTLILSSFVLSCFTWGVAGVTTLTGVKLLFFSGKTPSPDATLPPVLAGKM